MKFTHNALTSITVEKVENITTSMTRAGLGDDTYRRQRQKERYLKCKAQQAQRDERKRSEFLQERSLKLSAAEVLTQKKSIKRQKKKQRQQQLKQKAKFIKKFNALGVVQENSEEQKNGKSESSVEEK